MKKKLYNKVIILNFIFFGFIKNLPFCLQISNFMFYKKINKIYIYLKKIRKDYKILIKIFKDMKIKKK